jgi:hypothetical protein
MAMPMFLARTGYVRKLPAGRSGGQGWIRTSVRLHGQIYSLLICGGKPPIFAAVYGLCTVRLLTARNRALNLSVNRESKREAERWRTPYSCDAG